VARSNGPLNFIGACQFCKRRHDNIGYAPSDRHPVTWLCWECVRKGRAIYRMKTLELDDYEQNAIVGGGEVAGAFLDKIGKTDLAQLTEDEWFHFLGHFLTGYSDTMRKSAEALKDTF
jgi:hypothetical protein